jgi:membrane-bound lytic murein transglycosylase B
MPFGKHLVAGLAALSLMTGGSGALALTTEDFSQCLVDFEKTALAKGVSPKIVEDSLAQVSLSQRVLELDRQQPEFTTTFADYFNRRVTQERVDKGRALLAEHRDLLERVANQYGVAPQYLVAFWGLETNYGSFFGRMKVLDSLATLACDARRSAYFTEELVSALAILDEGAITPERMEGSWAGAMGHVQFMPSVFLRYAVDYDGDRRRDLWGSVPDAMASAANFLQGLGWKEGDRWGREVSLPKGFSYLEAGLNNKRPLSEWHKLGVRRADGSPLPQADMEASLLVPAGHAGPVFLVYRNFNVMMGWNRSEFYGLAVGHLADRIAGTGRLLQPPPDDAPRLHREQIMTLQEQLNQRGFEAGEPDGILGPATRRAISQFQHNKGMVADGFPHREVLQYLDVGLSENS